jgi:hypothetical protein
MIYERDGKKYTVIVDNNTLLNTFSRNGSMHDLVYNGQAIQVELLFDDETSQYGGPIVIFFDEAGKFWMTPTYHFFDGRYTRLEVTTV